MRNHSFSFKLTAPCDLTALSPCPGICSQGVKSSEVGTQSEFNRAGTKKDFSPGYNNPATKREGAYNIKFEQRRI
jgi:hypothetical protein